MCIKVDKTKKGFTLLELIIVISIIMSLSFFVIFNLQKMNEEMMLKTQVNQVMESLIYSSKLADRNEEYSKFTISDSKGERVCRVIDKNKGLEKVVFSNHLNKNIRIFLEDIYINGGMSKYYDSYGVRKYIEVKFYNDTSSGNGTIIFDTKKSSKYYKITIVPTSKRIHLYELDKR